MHKGKPLPVSTRLKRETEVHDCILFVITNASVHNADLMQLWQDLLAVEVSSISCTGLGMDKQWKLSSH